MVNRNFGTLFVNVALLYHSETACSCWTTFILSHTEGQVNDTLTGDPLLTVPIVTPQDNGSSTNNAPSLCYEVHGKANEYFNLISDECTTVNAYYETAQTNSTNIDINVVTRIGVRTVGDCGTCTNIEVDLDSCTASIDEVQILSMTSVVTDGIRLRWNANGSRVRIAVPNCADTMLVMWVFCTSGRVEDPVTWEYFSINFIRFVVMRGLNLNEFAHGLIGNTIMHRNRIAPSAVKHVIDTCARSAIRVIWAGEAESSCLIQHEAQPSAVEGNYHGNYHGN